jgi:endonuclease YncB( thermonuclease family)
MTMLRCKQWALAAAASLSFLATAGADDRDFSGSVRRIFDGDSFIVRPARGKDVDVRLQDIDAPEKAQPYGNAARVALIGIIGDRDVFVDVIDTDRYGRKIVRVYREPDRLDVIKALVRDGHVWVYRRTVHDASLIKLEEDARASHRGLWALPEDDRLPPWQYRYLRRKNKQASSVPTTLFTSEPRPWYSESTEASRFHQPITPITAGIVVLPRAVRGGEAGAGRAVIVP